MYTLYKENTTDRAERYFYDRYDDRDRANEAACELNAYLRDCDSDFRVYVCLTSEAEEYGIE